MKKIFLFLTCFIIVPISSTLALECKIKDSTAKPLEEYFSNLDRLSGQFAAQLDGQYSTKVGDVFMAQKRRIQNSFNSIIDWSSYESTASFYVKYGTSNAYVSPIWRDYSRLEQQEQRINNLLKTMINRGYMPHNIDIQKVCQGFNQKQCAFDGRSTGQIDVYDAVKEILKNHQKIMNLYRLNITADTKSVMGNVREVPKYLFTSEKFATEMGEYYNTNTTEACGKDEKENMGFFEKTGNNIANFSNRYAEGMDSWKRAIAKINGTMDAKEYTENERKLLEAELSRQGMSTKQSEIILKNLDRYNQPGNAGGWSRDNNFISNSFQYVQNSVTTQVDTFDEAMREVSKRGESEVSMAEFESIKNEKTSEAEITEQSRLLFEKLKISSQFQDNDSMLLEKEFIEVHSDLNQAIGNLTNVKRTAQKICNDQGNGLGKCDTQ